MPSDEVLPVKWKINWKKSSQILIEKDNVTYFPSAYPDFLNFPIVIT